MSDSGTKTEKKTARGRAAEAPRIALDRGLKIARWPADAALRVAPKDSRVRRAGESVVDRTDAAVRGAAGAALRDDKLREGAKELRKKAAERAKEEKTELDAAAEEKEPAAPKRSRRTSAKSPRSRKTATATKETDDSDEAADAKAEDERTEALQDEAEAAVEEAKAEETVAPSNGDR